MLDFIMGHFPDARGVSYKVELCGDRWELVRYCEKVEEGEAVGYIASYDVVDEVWTAFSGAAEAEGFHVVEHLLLRPPVKSDDACSFLPAQLPESCGCDDEHHCDCGDFKAADSVHIEVRDPYSFRISVVLPAWPTRFRDVNFAGWWKIPCGANRRRMFICVSAGSAMNRCFNSRNACATGKNSVLASIQCSLVQRLHNCPKAISRTKLRLTH